MNKRFGAVLALALGLVGAPPAAAQFRVAYFDSAGTGVAKWIVTKTPPPTGDPSVIELSVRASGDWGMISIADVPSTVPASSPTYDFRSSVTGASGGSPRMVLRLRNEAGELGGGVLQPASVVAGQWTHMDGQSGWENYGGTCGYRPNVSYSELLACHPGASVVSLEMFSDSSWLYPAGYELLVDNITFGPEQPIANQDVDFLSRPPTPPVVGETVEVKPLGLVRVSLPEGTGTGNYVPLQAATSIPVGSVVDTRRGEVRLQSAVDNRGQLQSGRFSKGRFLVRKPRSTSDAGITQLRMLGAAPAPCPPGSARAARLVRRMWSDVRRRLRHRGSRANAAASAPTPKGGIRVVAQHSTATAQNAAWRTVDRCDGTLTRVTRGKVVVRDLRRGRSIELRAGKRGSYLARP